MDITFGSTILSLDETFSEGRDFLSVLLEGISNTPIYEVAIKPIFRNFQTLRLDDQQNDIIIEGTPPTSVGESVEKKRREGKAIFVHTYLPDLLIRYGGDNVLKIIESWKSSIQEHNTIEFFLLPRKVFAETEGKIFSLVDGVIDFKIVSSGDSYLHVFTPMRSCKTEFNMSRFEYSIEENKLLIKFRGRFSDRVSTNKEEIRALMKFISESSQTLYVKQGHIQPNLPVQERLLLSQVLDHRVSDSLTLLFDRSESLLKKLAEWNSDGFIEFLKMELKKDQPIKTKLGLKSRIVLTLPAWMSTRLIMWRGLSSHRVPAQAYLMRRKGDEAFYSVFFPPSDKGHQEVTLERIEEFLQDIATRRVTEDVIRRLGEDPRNLLEIKYIPKVISLMLSSGYGVKPRVRKVNADLYQIDVPDCPICFESRSDKPVCQSLTGAITGNASYCFKRKVNTEETKCIAKGDDRCTFLLRLQ